MQDEKTEHQKANISETKELGPTMETLREEGSQRDRMKSKHWSLMSRTDIHVGPRVYSPTASQVLEHLEGASGRKGRRMMDLLFLFTVQKPLSLCLTTLLFQLC